MGKVAALLDDAEAVDALKALHKSEQILGLLVQNTAEYAIYTLDLDGLVTSWNSGAELIKGYARDEILGRHFGIFFTSEEQEAGKPAQALVKVRSKGKYLEEGWRVRKDGTRFWASVVLQSLIDPNGQPIGFAKITRDETSKRADKADKDTQYERLKLATASGRIGIWDWDIDRNLMLWDDWMYHLYRANRQDVRTGYELWQHHLHPDDRVAAEQAVADCLNGVRSYNAEFRIIWDDGSIHHIIASGSVTRDESGRATRMIGCNLDVTPLVQAERAREKQRIQSKRWLDLAEEIAHVGHWTIGVPGQEIFWSDEVYRIHGLDKRIYEPDIVSAINAFHSDDRDRISAIIATAISEKGGFEFEARLIRPDGEIRYVMSRGVVMLSDDDEATSIFGAFIDITEQKQIQRKLENANLRVTQANEELNAIAHIDSLTGLPNRREFDKTLNVEFGRSIREKTPIGLIMVDLDYFKSYNDLYGHLVGDACLRCVAAAIGGALRRPIDLAARYGGEEFAVILPSTSLTGANAVAQLIVEAVRALGIEHRQSPEAIVTVSCGVSSFELAAAPSEQIALVASADRALYRAKNAGKNQAMHSSDWCASSTGLAAPSPEIKRRPRASTHCGISR